MSVYLISVFFLNFWIFEFLNFWIINIPRWSLFFPVLVCNLIPWSQIRVERNSSIYYCSTLCTRYRNFLFFIQNISAKKKFKTFFAPTLLAFIRLCFWFLIYMFREFSFDGVFPVKATQKNVYDTVAKRLVSTYNILVAQLLPQIIYSMGR